MPKLIWLDLETTGLDPVNDEILEVAVSEAELLDPFVAKPIYHAVLPLPGIMYSRFIVEMHTKNGLLVDCIRESKDRAFVHTFVEHELCSRLPPIADPEERYIMAGANVGFDRSFIRAKWPQLFSRFSHRLYDTSAIKLFCRSLGMEKIPRSEVHRAGPDVLEAIEHARLCAVWLRDHAHRFTLGL